MTAIDRLEAKAHVMLNVSATVYLTNPVITELKLRCDGKEYTCYSNADFRDLTQLSQLEGEKTVYAWFPFVSEAAAEDASLPRGLRLAPGKAGYTSLETSRPEDQVFFHGLDLIHAYYEANKAKLQTERMAREAAERAREKALRENPPKPQDTKVIIWKNQSAQ